MQVMTDVIQSSAQVANHNNHKLGKYPCGGHSVSLQNVHKSSKVFINGKEVVVDGDEGTFSCPCHSGSTVKYKVVSSNVGIVINGKNISLKSNTQITSDHNLSVSLSDSSFTNL